MEPFQDVILGTIQGLTELLPVSSSGHLVIAQQLFGLKESGEDISDFSIKKALIVGLVQGVAIIPGISRSGSTIAVGLFLGLNRESAAKYSFLLSIPAILGAAVLILKDISADSAIDAGSLIIGLLTSCLVGYASLRFLMHIVKKGNLHLFAPYCWLAGSMALIFGL